MNLAFQALAIFALSLPGIILKSTFRNGFFWDRPRQLSPIAEEVAYSLILACALHAVFATIVNHFWPIDLQAVVLILIGQYGKDSELLEPALAALTGHPARVFMYFTVLYGTSALLGFGAHALIRRLRWDRRHRFLRFNHQWHYLAAWRDRRLSREQTSMSRRSTLFPLHAWLIRMLAVSSTWVFSMRFISIGMAISISWC